MKSKKIIYLGTMLMGLCFSSCKKDVPDPDKVLPTSTSDLDTYDNGVFITNEGAFGGGTGTVSFFDRSNATVSNEIFYMKNIYSLGNIVQSMNIFNGTGYIVVNNADKIEVVNGSSFKSEGVISGLSKPRYFMGINNTTGYVSQWGSGTGSIQVIDLASKKISSSIPTGSGAENMVKVGDKVYVTCSGGLGSDSVVTVINSATNTVMNTINVGAGPSGIQVDANGAVWVLCSGKWNSTYSALEKTGSLVRIDVSADTVDLRLPFASTSSQPSNLVINGAKTGLYYTYNGKVISHNITATSLTSSSTINRNFYALGIDPSNDYFYGADAGDFSSNGKVLRYSPSGVVVDSFSVGVIPGNFFFN